MSEIDPKIIEARRDAISLDIVYHISKLKEAEAMVEFCRQKIWMLEDEDRGHEEYLERLKAEDETR